MKYVIARIVEADSLEQALRKARRLPVTEAYIHTGAWEKNNYALTDEKTTEVGFGAKEKKPRK